MSRYVRLDPQRSAGFTLVETMTAVALMTIGLMGVALSVVANARAYDSSVENTVAIQSLRQVAEAIRGAPFGDVVKHYQGLTFESPEIQGEVRVRIFLDETDSSPEAAALGLPRDLDGDGAATTTDISGSYLLLPIHIELSWQGEGTTQVVQAFHLSTEW